MEKIKKIVERAFKERFGGNVEYFVRAPGRVNLIGEHTDYNDGFVFPIAIEQDMWIALRRNTDKQIMLHSLDFPHPVRFSLDEFEHGEGWEEYVKGITWVLKTEGYQLNGWEGVLASDIPVGAGLSSSAAIEMVLLRAFQVVSGFVWDGKRMAQLARKADHEWVGIQSGIMDQLISAEGKTGHALLIDCRTLDIEPVPIPEGVRIVILDTTTRRGLVDSIYNQRVRECCEAADFFGVSSLRDVSVSMIEKQPRGLTGDVYRRARHVVTENARTLAGVEALRKGDVLTFGSLMNESHRSLKEDYEVSSKELDLMADFARQQKGCYGARMTGAGFGGCVVAMVNANDVDAFVPNVRQLYVEETGLEPLIYVTGAMRGASVE